MEFEVGRKFWRFHGGLKLRHWKRISLQQPLEFAGVPPRLVIALRQHQGEEARPAVEVGQRVRRGELIADIPEGGLGSRLHAPASGTVTAIEPRQVISDTSLPVRCIEIETDGADDEVCLPAMEQWREASPEALAQRAWEAGVVGLGGAVFPTHVKLVPLPDKPTELLIVNGAECEPYIASDETLMRMRPQQLIEGTRIMARALSARKTVIAIEDQMGAVEHILREAVREMEVDDVQVVKIPTIYPEGGERQLIQVLTGKEVPSGGIPPDIGIGCLNVGTAVAVHDAVIEGRPLVSRVVTVTGRGVARPCNVDALIGTPAAFLIESAGGYSDHVTRLVMGGPMMGIPLSHDGLSITKASNCLLALIDRDTESTVPELPCIRCMDCERVCPAQLLPQQLYWYIKADDFEQVEKHDLFDCIECGCCAYVCPSHLPLVDYYRYAKAEIRIRQARKAEAAHARDRFDARSQRLEQEKSERESRLERKRLDRKKDRKSEIAAAVARARARKGSTHGDDADEV